MVYEEWRPNLAASAAPCSPWGEIPAPGGNEVLCELVPEVFQPDRTPRVHKAPATSGYLVWLCVFPHSAGGGASRGCWEYKIDSDA